MAMDDVEIYDCQTCGHMFAVHVLSPVMDDGHLCLIDDCDCRDYVKP